MKHPCELIQDLLPLYAEDLCSPASREAVEGHLRECPDCRRLTGAIEIIPPEAPNADRAVEKGIRKTRRRWKASLLAALLVVPLLLLSIHQVVGYGICFTNLDDAFTAWRFARALEDGDWEEAARMYDFSTAYANIQEALSEGIQTPTFSSLTLDGQTWYLSDSLEDALVGQTLAETIYFIAKHTGESVLFPPELLDALWEMAPPEWVLEEDSQRAEALLQHTDRYSIEFLHWGYTLCDTPWGPYYLPNGMSGLESAENYSQFALLPESIYQEGKPLWELRARESYEATLEVYGPVADMTEDEFSEYMQTKYASELAALEDLQDDGISLQFGGIPELRYHDGWAVTFPCSVQMGTEIADLRITLQVRGSQVIVGGIGYDSTERWLNSVSNILSPFYHPDF